MTENTHTSHRKRFLFTLIDAFHEQNKPLDLFLRETFRKHRSGSTDRRFITETIYSLLRKKELLDAMGETSTKTSWEKRYEVLQSPLFQEENWMEKVPSDLPPHIRSCLPLFLFEKLKKAYGQEKALQLASVYQSQAPICLRINPLKTTRESLLTKLKAYAPTKACEQSPLGILMSRRCNLSASKEFRGGLFEMQDEASQLLALSIPLEKNAYFLDYCAGSGGKSLALAHKLTEGKIFLHEPRENSLKIAYKRLEKAGFFSSFPFSPESPLMDTILLDVPCSGSGTWRRHPESLWSLTPASFEALIDKQREIFDEALPFLKEGGSIVYATCSLFTEENEEQIDFFCKKYSLVPKGAPFTSLPEKAEMDGFFAATLVRA